ncbi:MAG: hypothetical protein ACK5LC_04385 [Coprobacillaceae bacterium]
MKLEKRIFEVPEIYTKGEVFFWEEDYISKKLLVAHLDTNFEGASRNHEFINKSVQWISEVAPVKQYPRLLDLGCGPGLYTERFYDCGYQVTGVDTLNLIPIFEKIDDKLAFTRMMERNVYKWTREYNIDNPRKDNFKEEIIKMSESFKQLPNSIIK